VNRGGGRRRVVSGGGDSMKPSISWTKRGRGVNGHRVREGEGKVAGPRFDSATHAWGRTANGGVWRSSRSNGRWRHGIGRKEKVPQVGWLGAKYAES
jgi:hypothetical protein